MEEERVKIRFALMKNNLSNSWLINLLVKKGIPADKVNLSDALRGARRSERAQKIISAAAEIVDSYERWQSSM